MLKLRVNFYNHTLETISLRDQRFLMKELWQSELDLEYLVFVCKQHTKVHINRVSCEKANFNGFVAQLLLATRYV